MHLVDEIFRDFKSWNNLDKLKEMETIEERFGKIKEIVSKVNIFKGEIEDLSFDEQLYLDYKIQQGGVEIGLCPFFYIFFSNKNMKFHKICKKDNSRAACEGVCKKCSKD